MVSAVALQVAGVAFVVAAAFMLWFWLGLLAAGLGLCLIGHAAERGLSNGAVRSS